MAKTAPLALAEKQVDKQIKSIEEAKIGDDQKKLLVNGLAGIKRMLQTVDQISDPKNPPADDSAWGKVVALGANQRSLSSILMGSDAAQDAF
jgi:hypothetical protein